MPFLAPIAAGAAAAMTAAAPALTAISTVGGIAASVMGASTQAEGYRAQAANAEALGQYQQKQYLEESYTSVAEAQRQAEEQRRRGNLVQSTLVARAAGSGVDASAGSVNKLSQDIAGRSEYASLMDLSRGQDMAAGYINQGAGAKYQGDLAESLVPQEVAGAYAGAASSVFGSLGRFKYG